MSYLDFHITDKMDKKQLKGGNIYFGSQFQRFQFIITGRAWQSKEAYNMAAGQTLNPVAPCPSFGGCGVI
jgi:hypothetical protein